MITIFVNIIFILYLYLVYIYQLYLFVRKITIINVHLFKHLNNYEIHKLNLKIFHHDITKYKI